MRVRSGRRAIGPIMVAAAVLMGEMAIVWMLPGAVRPVVSLMLIAAAVTALLMAGLYAGRGRRRRSVGRS